MAAAGGGGLPPTQSALPPPWARMVSLLHPRPSIALFVCRMAALTPTLPCSTIEPLDGPVAMPPPPRPFFVIVFLFFFSHFWLTERLRRQTAVDRIQVLAQTNLRDFRTTDRQTDRQADRQTHSTLTDASHLPSLSIDGIMYFNQQEAQRSVVKKSAEKERRRSSAAAAAAWVPKVLAPPDGVANGDAATTPAKRCVEGRSRRQRPHV